MSSASSRRSSLSGKLQLGRIVGEHLPAAPGVVVAGLAIDGDAHVDAFAVTLARRGRERCFERLEDDFLVDALLVRDRVDHHQNFFVHRANSAPLIRSGINQLSGASRALCIPRSAGWTAAAVHSSVISLSPTSVSRPANRLRPSTGCIISSSHPLAGEALEMRPRPQHPIQTRRGHLERVVARDRIGRIQRLADRPAHPLAIVERDSLGRIDVQPQQPAARRAARTPVPTARTRGRPRPARAARSAGLAASVTSGTRPWPSVFAAAETKNGPKAHSRHIPSSPLAPICGARAASRTRKRPSAGPLHAKKRGSGGDPKDPELEIPTQPAA